MTSPITGPFLREGVRTYPETATQAAFLLGGIGTGNFSVGSRGEFRDWEIFNWPGKGNFMPFTFFAVRTEDEDGEVRVAVAEAEIAGPHAKSHGYFNGELAGLPRFKTSRMWSEYPFVYVELESPEMPVSVVLEAFTPFIPLHAEDSGIPAAVLRYHVRNVSGKPLRVSVVGSAANALGFEGYDVFGNLKLAGDVSNTLRKDAGIEGLWFTNDQAAESEAFGTMAFASTASDAEHRPEWLQGQWTDNAQDFWDDFVTDGHVDAEREATGTGSELGNFYDFSYLRLREKVGSICISRELGADQTESFEFVLAWHIPNRPKGWVEVDAELEKYAAGGYSTIRNHYVLRYGDAWDVLSDVVRRLPQLEQGSRAFTESLYSSTLPPAVVDAVANNLTVIRSHTCFWLEDGNFYGWEGIRDYVGCGTGNVNHVWNYAVAIAYLFPELERTMRVMEFELEIGEDGALPFRSKQSLGDERWEMVPAADGHLGSIIRACREWRLSDDREYLERIWPGIVKSMDFALEHWDGDGDLVPDTQQSNTYDIEFYGANGMMGLMMVGALRACAEMASDLGHVDLARRYADQAETSAHNLEELCWNGEFLVQDVEDVDEHRYQFGLGCHSDQLLGQFIANSASLGPLIDHEKIRKALVSIAVNNRVGTMRDIHTVQRVYALNDEPGLVLCTWPNGGRPRFPFGYSDEVWTGVEYQVASTLAFEGETELATAIVEDTRSRQDGFLRSPWSENEAGHHYSRSLASYGLLTAFSGFEVDLPRGIVRFAPRVNGPFRSFWCHGKGWGTYRQWVDAAGELQAQITVLDGELGTDDPQTPASSVDIVNRQQIPAGGVA